MAVEEKQGISRLEHVVEEISEAERAKELRREQKRLKKKARRKEKCKCGTHLTISTANNELQTEETAKNEEELEEEEVCVNEIVEETRDMNGHGDSCEDDEDWWHHHEYRPEPFERNSKCCNFRFAPISQS